MHWIKWQLFIQFKPLKLDISDFYGIALNDLWTRRYVFVKENHRIYIILISEMLDYWICWFTIHCWTDPCEVIISNWLVQSTSQTISSDFFIIVCLWKYLASLIMVGCSNNKQYNNVKFVSSTNRNIYIM